MRLLLIRVWTSLCVISGYSKSPVLRVVRQDDSPVSMAMAAALGHFPRLKRSCQFCAGRTEEAFGGGRGVLYTTDGVFYSRRMTPSFSLFCHLMNDMRTLEQRNVPNPECVWVHKQQMWWYCHFFFKPLRYQCVFIWCELGAHHLAFCKLNDSGGSDLFMMRWPLAHGGTWKEHLASVCLLTCLHEHRHQSPFALVS